MICSGRPHQLCWLHCNTLYQRCRSAHLPALEHTCSTLGPEAIQPSLSFPSTFVIGIVSLYKEPSPIPSTGLSLRFSHWARDPWNFCWLPWYSRIPQVVHWASPWPRALGQRVMCSYLRFPRAVGRVRTIWELRPLHCLKCKFSTLLGSLNVASLAQWIKCQPED